MLAFSTLLVTRAGSKGTDSSNFPQEAEEPCDLSVAFSESETMASTGHQGRGFRCRAVGSESGPVMALEKHPVPGPFCPL